MTLHPFPLLRCILALCLLCLLLPAGQVRAQSGSGDPLPDSVPNPQIVSREGGISVMLDAPLSAHSTDGLHADGFDIWQEPGQPQVPVTSLLLPIPPEVTVTLSYDLDSTTLSWIQPPSLNPPLHAWTDGTPTETLQPTVLGGVFPEQPVVYQDLGILRGQRLGRLLLFPAQVDLEAGVLIRHTRFSVSLDFVGPRAESIRGSGGCQAGALAACELMDEQVAPGAGPITQAGAPGTLSAAAGRQSDGTRRLARMAIRSSGLYGLTYEELAGLGIPPADLTPNGLQIRSRGQPVPFHLQATTPGTFGPGDLLIFYGVNEPTYYADETVYWLEVSPAPRGPMTSRNVSPGPTAVTPATQYRHTLRFEQQNIYLTRYPQESGGDHWFWNYIRSGDPNSRRDLPFALPGLIPAGSGEIRLALQGVTQNPTLAPDHRVTVHLNGAPLAELTYDGLTPTEQTIPIPAGRLLADGNVLSLWSGAGDSYIDWFSVNYVKSISSLSLPDTFAAPGPGRWRFDLSWSEPVASGAPLWLLDISQPQNPVLLTGFAPRSGGVTFDDGDATAQAPPVRYALSQGPATPDTLSPVNEADLRGDPVGADWLIVTPPAFRAAAERLAQHRGSQGLRARVIDVQHVYNQFGQGTVSPQAIRDFLAWTYQNWPRPAPSFVVLMGDGTDDPLHHAAGRTDRVRQNHIPAFMAYVDPFIGLIASDLSYVLIDGNDDLPDMALGRLPVETPVQAQTVVDKLIEQDLSLASPVWLTKPYLFAADNPDLAGDFHDLSRQTLALLAEKNVFPARPLFLETFGGDPAAIRREIVDSLNHGVRILNYMGHASETAWAVERLLSIQELGELQRPAVYSLLMSMTCREGGFHYHSLDGLSESLLRLTGAGIVGAWAPAGAGVSTGHHFMQRGFYRALLDPAVPDRVGTLILAGYLALFQEGPQVFHFLPATFNYLGDPATQLPPGNYTVKLPVVLR